VCVGCRGVQVLLPAVVYPGSEVVVCIFSGPVAYCVAIVELQSVWFPTAADSTVGLALPVQLAAQSFSQAVLAAVVGAAAKLLY